MMNTYTKKKISYEIFLDKRTLGQLIKFEYGQWII